MSPAPTSAEYTRWLNWLTAIEQDGVGLSSWEEQFVADIRDKFDRWGDTTHLSERQAEQLERIYADRTA